MRLRFILFLFYFSELKKSSTLLAPPTSSARVSYPPPPIVTPLPGCDGPDDTVSQPKFLNINIVPYLYYFAQDTGTLFTDTQRKHC